MRAATPRLSLIAAALLLLSLLSACGGGGKSTESPATETTVVELSPAEILTRASKQLASTQSVAFDLAVTGETWIDTKDTIQLLAAKGNLIRPDKVYTEFKIKIVKSVTLSMKLITIDEKHWSTDLITGKWTAAPEEFGYNPSILFDNQNGIGPVMDKIFNATRRPNETVQGRDCYVITATVSQDVIGELTSNSMTGDVSVELWIDTQNFDLLQANLSESPDVTSHVPAGWVLTLTEQDKPMQIDAPDAPFSVASPEASPAASPFASPAASPEAAPVATPGAPI